MFTISINYSDFDNKVRIFSEKLKTNWDKTIEQKNKKNVIAPPKSDKIFIYSLHVYD
jgi:hypothetical protein